MGRKVAFWNLSVFETSSVLSDGLVAESRPVEPERFMFLIDEKLYNTIKCFQISDNFVIYATSI